MNTDNQVAIISFTNELKEPFKVLNLNWLKKYFYVEPKDKKVLSNPQTEIIDKGGFIFYAKYNDEIVGTLALIKINDTHFELSKMAVSESAQGLGIGNKLLSFIIAFAKENKIQALILYSNRILKPAIHLYEKFGFVEIALEKVSYERADIKMQRTIDI